MLNAELRVSLRERGHLGFHKLNEVALVILVAFLNRYNLQC